jgi:threonine dehydratase
MPESAPRQYNELLPYGQRFRQEHFTSQLPAGEHHDAATVFPDIPEDLVLAADRQPARGDWERLHADVPGDPMFGYAYNSQVRHDFLAAEKAAQRLGVTGLEQLDPFVLAVLRAQQTIGDIVLRTALDSQPLLPGRQNVLTKHDADQGTGSFKIRGAHYKMNQLTTAQLEGGVIAASAGNHAQGVAHSAYVLGAKATLVMPVNTPQVKIAGVRQYGAEVQLIGTSFAAAAAACAELVSSNPELTYVPAYDDEDIMIGQATLIAEILQQNAAVTHVAVPVGGGGLLAGTVRYAGLVRPDVKILGVEPTGANGMSQSVRAGHYVESRGLSTIAEGAAVQPGRKTFDVIRQFLRSGVMLDVGDQEIARAAVTYNELGFLTEATGAIALAGLTKYVKQTGASGTMVAIRSGRNVDQTKLDQLYQLAG